MSFVTNYISQYGMIVVLGDDRNRGIYRNAAVKQLISRRDEDETNGCIRVERTAVDNAVLHRNGYD